MKTKLTHEERLERRKQMAEAVRNGSAPGEVAGQFGVTLKTVQDACAEYQVSLPKKPTEPAAA